MRIAVLAQSYPPIVSGAAFAAQNIAQNMAKRGHTVMVITASDNGEAYTEQNGRLRLARLNSIDNPFRIHQKVLLYPRAAVQQALKDFKPDLLHVHDMLQIGLSGLEYTRSAGIPAILTVHQLPWFISQYLPNTKPLREQVENMLWSYACWLLPRFDAVIAPTRTISNLIRMKTAVQVGTISNGVDLQVYHPAKLSRREEIRLRAGLDLPAKVPVVLHVGRLDADKFVERVIHASLHVLRETDAHLLVVGDGGKRPVLQSLSKSLGIAHRVHFPGFITCDQGLPQIYRLASLFVTASEIETQGIVLLEAAACGLPIAAVRATCIPEIVHHERNGLLTEPGDVNALASSMTWLIRNPSAAERMGKASAALARQHDKLRTVDLYESLYRNLIHGAKAGAITRRVSTGIFDQGSVVRGGSHK
jgi:glycosyltransferase involved in cell wall biosynthesis